MIIELYKSALCPRCAYATNVLKKLKSENPDLEIINYDILANLKAFKEAGISMIPSIKIDGDVKSWLIPKEKEIQAFIQAHK